MQTTLLRGMTGASSRTSASGSCSPVSSTPAYSGSPMTEATISSPSAPPTTPYWGSSPVVKRAILTRCEPTVSPSAGVIGSDHDRVRDGEPSHADSHPPHRSRVARPCNRARDADRRLGGTAPRAAATRYRAPGGRLPLHLLLLPTGGAAALASRCPRRADR